MAFLSREDIMAIVSVKKESIDMPEWGGSIFVRAMSGAESDILTDLILAHEEKTGNNRLPHLKAIMAILTVCDGDGGRMFDMNDMDMLLSKDGGALTKIFEVARRLNGLTPDSEETITKNSEGGDQPNGFGISLPLSLADVPLPNGSSA